MVITAQSEEEKALALGGPSPGRSALGFPHWLENLTHRCTCLSTSDVICPERGLGRVSEPIAGAWPGEMEVVCPLWFSQSVFGLKHLKNKSQLIVMKTSEFGSCIQPTSTYVLGARCYRVQGNGVEEAPGTRLEKLRLSHLNLGHGLIWLHISFAFLTPCSLL